MIRKRLHWLFIIAFAFALSCAKQSTPTGGPKDTIPPSLVSSTPANESVNFKGRQIELLFSEHVIVTNPKEQLIITPTIGKKYEVTARKKSVSIKIEEPLQDSTTYTFNFREAVQDITEKNPARNLQLAFSTGVYVDSLSIEGKVIDIINGKEVPDATVAVHTKNDTFNIFKHPAVFLTKTDKSGKFKIDHLKPATYYIYAIQDKNKNLIADSKSETYGFKQDSIVLTDHVKNIEIGMVKLDARKLTITSARPYNTYFNIRTIKNIREFKLFSVENIPLYYSYGDDESNVKLYNTIGERDSLAIQFSALDSIGNYLDTTLFARFNKREVEKEKFTSKIERTFLNGETGSFQAAVSFTKPISHLNFDSIYFEVDSITRLKFTENDLTWDNYYNVCTLKKSFDKKYFLSRDPKDTTNKVVPKNQLYFGAGAFISIENDSSKVMSQKVGVLKLEDLSKIIYGFKTSQPVIVQLLNGNYEVMMEKYTPSGDFTDLQPGDYIVRVVLDKNNNQTWDPGNYFTKTEPEKIIYYKEPDKKNIKITLKANWDYELSPMLITY